MSELKSWAENECRLACKKENPDFDFDSDNFDYGCSCYKSALKAYRSLMEDGHSGMSFSFTKNILIRLMNGQPLTPITDEDFFAVEYGTEQHPIESESYLKEYGLKTSRQCPRMSSLFREETVDGKVTYRDIDLFAFYEKDSRFGYHTHCAFLEEMYPIKMPYYPPAKPYKVITETFLVDKKNGDFDTRAFLYLITPEGDKVVLNRFFTTPEDGNGWKEITEREYNALYEKRIKTR